MNGELERMWKEAVMSYLKNYPSIFLEDCRRSQKPSVRIVGVQFKI
jgi:hypothetical protein